MKNNEIISNLNKLAIPLILSSISSTIMGIIDQSLVGHISIYAYGGVGLVTSSINSIVGIIGAMSIAFNILGSKDKVEENLDELNNKFTTYIIMNLFIGVISFLIINIWCSQILKIGFALEGEILKEASGYIKIFSISILLNLMIFTYSTIFKIFRETKHIFSTTIIVNLINIALDYILIFKVNLGSRGAAIATIIALFINVIIYIYKSKNLVKINFSIKNVVKRIKHILNFSMPFMGQEFMEDIVFIIGVNAIIARVGVLELSTYTLITQIINIVLMPMFGYTTANLSLVSENFTKNNIEKCEYISKYTSIILIFIHLIMFVIIFLFKDYIPKLITSDTALCNFSTKFLPIAIFIQILNYIMSVYKSSIQAINCQKWTLKVTFFINICTLVLIFLWGKNLYNVYICIGISYLLNFALFKSKYRKLLNGQYSVLDKY